MQLSSWKPLLWKTIRVVAVVVLLGFLFAQVDAQAFFRYVANASILLLTLSLLLRFVEKALLVSIWRRLMYAQGKIVPFWPMLRINFISYFLGTFLPSVSADVLRAYGLARYLDEQGGVGDSASSVLMERLVGMFTLMLTCMVGAILVLDNKSAPLVLTVCVLGLLAVLAIALSLWFGLLAVIMERLPERLRKRLWNAKIQRFVRAVESYRDKPGIVLQVIGMMLVFQMLRALIPYVTALALGVNFSLLYFMAFIPLVVLTALLPISIGGLGVSQGAFVGLFATVGMDPAAALAISLLVNIILLISNLPGGIFYALDGFGRSHKTVAS